MWPIFHRASTKDFLTSPLPRCTENARRTCFWDSGAKAATFFYFFFCFFSLRICPLALRSIFRSCQADLTIFRRHGSFVRGEFWKPGCHKFRLSQTRFEHFCLLQKNAAFLRNETVSSEKNATGFISSYL